MLPIIIAVKVGIKSCKFAREYVSFVYTYIDVTTQLKLRLHEQTQVIANATCRLGSQQFVSYFYLNGNHFNW